MKTSKAVKIFMGYQAANSGEKTIKNYRIMLDKFEQRFGEKEIDQLTSQDLFNFLIQDTEGQKQTTKRLKFTLIKALFNFVSTNIDESFPIPAIARF